MISRIYIVNSSYKAVRKMGLNKTGKFIASIRKEKGLTQRELAEKLDLSEKTISKWERGAGFPDVSLILPLCKCLEIDVNELMTGERLPNKQYRINAENNLLKLMNRTNPKLQYTISTISAIVTILVTLGLILLVGFVIEEVWIKILVCIMSVLLVVSNIAVILLLAVHTEVFECCHCGEKFVPTMREYIMGAHTIKKRYLKCPHCHKKGWDKFYITDKQD